VDIQPSVPVWNQPGKERTGMSSERASMSSSVQNGCLFCSILTPCPYFAYDIPVLDMFDPLLVPPLFFLCGARFFSRKPCLNNLALKNPIKYLSARFVHSQALCRSHYFRFAFVVMFSLVKIALFSLISFATLALAIPSPVGHSNDPRALIVKANDNLAGTVLSLRQFYLLF